MLKRPHVRKEKAFGCSSDSTTPDLSMYGSCLALETLDFSTSAFRMLCDSEKDFLWNSPEHLISNYLLYLW
jgi:hypothetical protein